MLLNEILEVNDYSRFCNEEIGAKHKSIYIPIAYGGSGSEKILFSKNFMKGGEYICIG
jgi:hypothetical protein